MTISIAWIRKAGKYNELVVASDSRLSSAGHVDICQKVFPLPRGDAFLAFSGETIIAFPFLFQLQAAVEDFHQSTDRSQDVTQMLGRVIALLNLYRDSWLNTDPLEFEPAMRTTRFLFGGWSWRYKQFFIYPIHYSKQLKQFNILRSSKRKKRFGLPNGELCVCIGNYTHEFIENLGVIMKDRKHLDYKPLEVLCNMLSDSRFTDRKREPDFWDIRDGRGAIGGAPQVIKVYEHANTLPIAVRWPRGDGAMATTLFGRPLFDWEKTFTPIYDPEDRFFYYPLADVADQTTISKKLSAE
ncbi:hypothetical protein SAMN05216374_2316 [Tardiphaga sp. OK246]|jgi:hypothetical protein|uniref:hypothetical protein n=1 Tax=Tardiphaga sp. OK246 TaxID=1855307 RepID=UPI000B6CA9DE|nr:hypothetical protein [Tardiphaga sp. OK246]SNT01624.1 hypothetical protein SAMN05216374_2316 [Tardiphaga sp. OK246]